MPLPKVSLGLSPAVTRSLVGIALLVLGAMTLIAFALPGGSLTDDLRNITAPWFGAARFFFPFVLLLAGWYIEWGPGQHDGAPWGRTLGGLALSYVALLGLIQLIKFRGDFTGGSIGRFLVSVLAPAVTPVGAGIVFGGLFLLGLMLMFDMPLRTLLAPATRIAKTAGTALQARTTATPAGAPMAQPANGRAAAVVATQDPGTASGSVRRGRGARGGAVPEIPGQVGAWGADVPAPAMSGYLPPASSTFAPRRDSTTEGERDAEQARTDASAAGLADSAASGAAVRPSGAGSAITPMPFEHVDEAPVDASRAAIPREGGQFTLPPLGLLDDDVAIADLKDSKKAEDTHRQNGEIIVAKLAKFGIAARVLGWNSGPVVTQYEVQPNAEIKLSRIESLADDLAMALAASSIRIEAPIPGKAAIGIEIPNKDSRKVPLRKVLEEVDFRAASSSRLTFALGRDVAGNAQAVDLAKMPHLLVAGATGSGKSVMVNALITSLLCNATPTEVRLILIDLKRVELAAYNEGEDGDGKNTPKLPHLLTPVITEPDKAKAALGWAVLEMERRYKALAKASARNIAAYNASPNTEVRRRLPYIVIVIDELADLMMREGKNVEDPIVRLAQKARATGIHMVLATQRPSVNVVTGLIKANFPSRIAFAMASQIDSRTILDQPGAEDLIGRGDMLYQPSDLPRPIRHQGVFVSDREIAAVVAHWGGQVDDPRYDASIVSATGQASGNVHEDGDGDEEADRLLMDAVGVIREYDRASASLLQRRLRIGYARAARIIDQLESRGYVGTFDGSNARVVLRRDEPTGTADEDD